MSIQSESAPFVIPVELAAFVAELAAFVVELAAFVVELTAFVVKLAAFVFMKILGVTQSGGRELG